jgi:hypothetical protein
MPFKSFTIPTFLLGGAGDFFSSFFPCFVVVADGGGVGRGSSAFTCVVFVGSFSLVIKRRPSSLKPTVGKSSVDDNAGGNAWTSSINFFLLAELDFFFCCIEDGFSDLFVSAAVQTPDAAVEIIRITIKAIQECSY